MARRIGSDGAKTRSAICDAAVRLIARFGYEALSMRRLAEEIDLGAAALYRYFPNKQAMLFHLLKAHMDDLLAAWSDANPGPGAPPAVRLEAFTRFHIRHHWTRADNLFLSYMELRSLESENFNKIENLRRTYERGIAEIIADGCAHDRFAPQDPWVTARAIIALLNGLTTWFKPDGTIKPDAIEEMYLNMVLGIAGTTKNTETTCLTQA
ncbi:MAG: TetR/AcrR family transcriptional regulator [Pseudomonadota bacterium]